MFPIYKAIKSSKKKKCFLYKKRDGSEKELDLKVHRSFLLFHFVNNRVPETSFPLEPIGLNDENMRILYKCVLYSYIAYKDRSLIEFPPEVNFEFEKLDSDINRIPYFIVTDSTINAIILSCRGSHCLDDFITDSLGNGVTYDGGKFHQGVFSTASYVFMTCQSKLIELNDLLNKSTNQENENESSTNNQESEDESSISNIPDIEYISSADFEDYSEEESDIEEEEEDKNDKDTDNPNQKLQSNQNLESKSSGSLKSKHKSLFNFHFGHKSDSKDKIKLDDEHETLSKHSFSTNSLPSSNLLDQSNSSQGSKTKIYQKMKKSPTKIIITGHSLGAAVAAVVTYMFKDKFPEMNVQCICFAPPPTMTRNLWEKTVSYIKSYMIEGDPIPFLSVRNIVAISDYLFTHEHANKIFKKLIHKYLNKKSIEEYEASSTMEEPLYPPGELFLIKFTGGEIDRTLIERQKMFIKKRKDKIKKKFHDLKMKKKAKKDKKKKKHDDVDNNNNNNINDDDNNNNNNVNDDDNNNNNNNDDDDDHLEEEEGKVEIKDEQIQLCEISNPEYFTYFVSNVSERNHFIKNYTRIMVRMLNKSIKKESHPK